MCSGNLDLLDDLIPTFSCFCEFVFNFALFGFKFLLLLGLEVLNSHLVLFVVGLCLFEFGVILEGGRASHLVFNLRFHTVDFFFCFFSLCLDGVVNFLVVSLCLLLDVIELLDSALLCI